MSVDRSREHTNTHDVELESTLQQLALDLRGDAVEADVAAREDSGRIGRGQTSSSHCEEIGVNERLNWRLKAARD